MKKIICILLAVVLICTMTVSAYAATPKLSTPDMPEIPDLSDDVSVELPDGFWEQYFKDHPMEIPELEAWTRHTVPGWREWLNSWYQWRAGLFGSIR